MRKLGKPNIRPVVQSSVEDYVRAIYLSHEKTGGARVTDLAKRLGVRKSSVSERMRFLAHHGFIIPAKYSNIMLTRKGSRLGEKLTRKHRLIEAFLHGVLNMPASRVHAEAEMLEHALSDDVARRLGAFLKNPSRDPHGHPIPSSH
jgi:DtxR family transcriptional regulator, Mn-dependent transcriptional regulator